MLVGQENDAAVLKGRDVEGISATSQGQYDIAFL